VGRFQPGQVRDGIADCLVRVGSEGASVGEIENHLSQAFGEGVPPSSIRSYLQLNTPGRFERLTRGRYRIAETALAAPAMAGAGASETKPSFQYGNAKLFQGDSLEWLASQPENSIHGVVTDPPYGLIEYTPTQLAKLRAGRGGTWRIPPSFDGHQRAPLPRFTTLTDSELDDLERFFRKFGEILRPVLVPGAHVVVAANPLVSHLVSYALDAAGFERRGEIVRLVTTMRGGDRPKNAHEEFAEVSVMPRSNWEPWLLFRKPVEGTVAENLRKWKTGGLRRISGDRPFGDVITSSPTPSRERRIASHPSLKPQAFMRQVVRAVLPLGEGVVLDPFAGAGSTLAAAEALGYESIGVELDPTYAELAARAIRELSKIGVGGAGPGRVKVDPRRTELG